jgi:hypothetical protein
MMVNGCPGAKKVHLRRGHIRREQRTWSPMSYVSREPHGWMSGSWMRRDGGGTNATEGFGLCLSRHAGAEYRAHRLRLLLLRSLLDHGNPCSFERFHGPTERWGSSISHPIVEICFAFGDAGVISIFCV